MTDAVGRREISQGRIRQPFSRLPGNGRHKPDIVLRQTIPLHSGRWIKGAVRSRFRSPPPDGGCGKRIFMRIQSSGPSDQSGVSGDTDNEQITYGAVRLCTAPCFCGKDTNMQTYFQYLDQLRSAVVGNKHGAASCLHEQIPELKNDRQRAAGILKARMEKRR